MTSINSINEILESIDTLEFASNSKIQLSILEELIALRKRFIDSNSKDERIKCQVEIDLINLYIIRGEMNPLSQQVKGDGQLFKYPNINLFSEEDLDYIVLRFQETKSPILKARYGYVLWHSKRKHFQYVKLAAESYFQIAEIISKHLSDDETVRDVGEMFMNSIENAAVLSFNVKGLNTLSDKIKDFIKDIVQDFSTTERAWISLTLINFMLTRKKIFKRESFNGLDQKIYQFAQSETDISKIQILEHGKKVNLKLGRQNLDWEDEIAECYEQLSCDREDENNIVSSHFAKKAIIYYEKSKNQEKVEELLKKYKKLKERTKLSKYSFEVNLTDVVEIADEYSDMVVKKSPMEILSLLTNNTNILPKYDECKRKVDEDKRKNPAHYLFTTMNLDGNGHVSEENYTEEEHIKHSILHFFNEELLYKYSILIEMIISKSVIKGKLSTEFLIAFLEKYSWLGKNITRKIKGNEDEVYNWLPLVIPAINEYFGQIQLHHINSRNLIYPILSIDSLTLKIEGILRDMVNLGGGISFYNKDGIIREKDINALLHDEIITNLLSKDDLFSFKFLLVEKSTINLRNRVAHSLMRHVSQYSAPHMNFLIISILKLAKYNPSE